jgi:hypothetical protein
VSPDPDRPVTLEEYRTVWETMGTLNGSVVRLEQAVTDLNATIRATWLPPPPMRGAAADEVHRGSLSSDRVRSIVRSERLASAWRLAKGFGTVWLAPAMIAILAFALGRFWR